MPEFSSRYKLTTWSRTLLEELIDAKLVNKLTAAYATLRFIAVFMRVRNWSAASHLTYLYI